MPDIAQNIKEIIISKSYELGFDDLKIARAEPLGDTFQLYKQWIGNGYHADMKWMENNFDRRENSDNILPGVKSILVTASNYYSSAKHTENNFKISRYAWGTDYHDTIYPRLKKLGKYISELSPGAEFRPYVDTGPVLEKIWAAKAGLGWIGKHGLIIHPRFGSWIFLGILFSTLELEPDTPVANRCGQCTRCIDSCPAKAIYMDSIVDSRKCLSYWTIESKLDNDIPNNILNNSNGWAFGCDTCQDVCPWNKKLAKETREPLFHPRNDETNLNSEIIKQMSDEEFRLRFRKSPVKRRKLQGIIKNINLFGRNS